jgi:CRP/FNR family transcriptional regulator, cyclic AMP receptor protein
MSDEDVQDIQTVSEALASVALFSNASPRGLSRISNRTQLENYPEGTVIFEKGEPSRHVYVVRAGSVEISNPGPDGKRQVQSTLAGGSIFGELGVLAGRARTATAETVEASDLWVIEGEAFVELFTSEPPVAIEVITSLARYVLDAEGVTEDLLFLDLKGRVAKRLLFLAGVREGHGIPAILEEIHMDKSELAALSGGTRGAVMRILEDFASSGYILNNENEIIVLRPEPLQELSRA